eukprot:GHUV01003103.1.p1 GENE.GHUV01003103.1~~GHUV01003103.1.p1  ORF type:complete len:415 (+),score=115.19 GHUV01003103.1:208-1452(+)
MATAFTRQHPTVGLAAATRTAAPSRSRLSCTAVSAQRSSCSTKPAFSRHVSSSSKQQSLRSLQTCASSSSSSDSSASGTWPWKSPDWRALQRQGRAAGDRECERSALVNEEIVYFIFQLELDAQLQRALNYEAYEAAQQIRVKRETVDMALRDMQERKASSAASSFSSMSEDDETVAMGQAAQASLDLSDSMSEGLRLRSEMQRAVQEERYADAAKYRDMLTQLDRQAKQAAALATEQGDASSNIQLRLGQRVVHKTRGYRGVVVGWDVGCCEDEEWQNVAKVSELKKGLGQPFYHLLVEVSDWSYDAAQPPVAYVAQELLATPELDDDGTSWSEVYGPDPLQHPYSYVLFLGQDARGDMLPCRQLRSKYNARRRDVYRPGTEENDADDDNSGGGGGGGGKGPIIPGIDMTSLQ